MPNANTDNWHTRRFSNVSSCCFTPNSPKSRQKFSNTQFASVGWWTMNTCIGKHTDNCRCCSMGQLLLSLPCGFIARIKYTKTKCPFQRQQGGGGGVQPSPPKSQTKVCPCCHGQNMPFCSQQTDAVVMYSAALQFYPKHRGHLSIIKEGLTNWAESNYSLSIFFSMMSTQST